MKKEISGVQDQGAKVEVKGEDALLQGLEQRISPNSSLCDEPRLLQMMNIM